MRGQTSSNHRQSSDSDCDGTAVVGRDGHRKVATSGRRRGIAFVRGLNSRLEPGRTSSAPARQNEQKCLLFDPELDPGTLSWRRGDSCTVLRTRKSEEFLACL